jgi:RNA-splicing ligase RtcB
MGAFPHGADIGIRGWGSDVAAAFEQAALAATPGTAGDRCPRTPRHSVRSRSTRGVAEEAPGAYKDVSAVIEAAEHAGLSCAVARLEPVICVKG